MAYVTELKGYDGPIDAVSPYHFYQHKYWGLRGAWRRALYAWTRREPCDAMASVAPEETVAGETVSVVLTVTTGPTPLPLGARMAVYFPIDFGGYASRRSLPCFQGQDGQTGYGARIVARASNADVHLATQVHSVGSAFTCVEATVEKGTLTSGDCIEIVIGDPSCRPPIVCEKAKTFPFRVALDYAGDGTFRPIQPNPTVRNVGNRARYFRCFAPATPAVGEPFSVRVVASDLENHNPSYTYQGQVALAAAEGALTETATDPIPPGCRGSAAVGPVSVADAGVTRINVIDEAQALMGQTNAVCPSAAPAGLRLYYGEIHSHTELSDGGGTPEDSYRWARDVEGLDFAGLADHFEDGQSYNYTLKDKWRITREVTRAFHEPGRFVTFLGYEIGTLERHRNVYFADDEGRMIVQGPDGERVTMTNVFDKLAGTDYLLIPHAPKFHGIDWHLPHDPERQRLVEICSNWGVSEEGGPLSVRHALDLGYKLGFTGGTDNHVAEAGNPDEGGITGVYATELTRAAIFDALRLRRTTATTGGRMIITFYVDGAMMGGETRSGGDRPRPIRARAITCDPVATLEVIRNGTVAHSVSGDGLRDVELNWDDDESLVAVTPERELTSERFAYYYLRVRTINGDLGWASPVWVHREP